MACFVVATSDESSTAHLVRLAQASDRSVSVAPDLEALRSDPSFRDAVQPLVLLSDPTGEGRLAALAVAFARMEADHAFLIYVADAIPAEIYKQLVRGGGAEWVTSADLPSELPELMRGAARADAPAGHARIVSCVPSKGGVGTTTIALEMGVELAARRKRSGARVAVLDLDFAGGTLADSLDLEPRFDIGELTGRPDRLDEQLIDIFTSRFSPRLDIFASRLATDGPEDVDPALVFGFLDAIGTRYDVVVLDIPHHGPPWTRNVIRGSDAVVAVGGSTVPALRRLSATLAGLDRLAVPTERIVVAVNGCAVDLFGRVSRKAEIERALPGRNIIHVRRDSASVSGAQDVGRPLLETSPRLAVSRELRGLAGSVETLIVRAESKRSAGRPSRRGRA